MTFFSLGIDDFLFMASFLLLFTLALCILAEGIVKPEKQKEVEAASKYSHYKAFLDEEIEEIVLEDHKRMTTKIGLATKEGHHMGEAMQHSFLFAGADQGLEQLQVLQQENEYRERERMMQEEYREVGETPTSIPTCDLEAPFLEPDSPEVQNPVLEFLPEEEIEIEEPDITDIHRLQEVDWEEFQGSLLPLDSDWEVMDDEPERYLQEEMDNLEGMYEEEDYRDRW